MERNDREGQFLSSSAFTQDIGKRSQELILKQAIHRFASCHNLTTEEEVNPNV